MAKHKECISFSYPNRCTFKNKEVNPEGQACPDFEPAGVLIRSGKMSFTLRLKSVPGGSVAWEACYGPPPAAEICSGILGLGAVWDCPYNPYGATDLRIYAYNSSWNITCSGTNLGPIYNGKDYVFDCSTGVLSEILPYEGTITRKELRHNSAQDAIPASAETGEEGIVYIWGRNGMSTNQKMGIEWDVYDPDGYLVQPWDQWETWHTGPGLEQGFMGPTFPISKEGDYHLDVYLKMNYDNPVIVDEWHGVLCTVEPALPEPEFRRFAISKYTK